MLAFKDDIFTVAILHCSVELLAIKHSSALYYRCHMG